MSIFTQERVGYNGEIFVVKKIRTMREGVSGCVGKVIDDPRIIPELRFLRTTGIDELPQIINVFRGEMVIFGPRPEPLEAFRLYSEVQKKDLIQVKPGFIGLHAFLDRFDMDYSKANVFAARVLRIICKKKPLGLRYYILYKTLKNIWNHRALR